MVNCYQSSLGENNCAIVLVLYDNFIYLFRKIVKGVFTTKKGACDAYSFYSGYQISTKSLQTEPQTPFSKAYKNFRPVIGN